MSSQDVVTTGEKVLEQWSKKGGGKKFTQALKRKPSGQIYRIPMARMAKVLIDIFGKNTMTPAQATAIMNDYVDAVETKLQTPYITKISREDPLLLGTMLSRRSEQRAKSAGMKVFAVASFRAVIEGSGKWKGKKKEYADIIPKHYADATEQQLEKVAGKDNKLGSQIGHAEGAGANQVGLAASTVAVAQAKSIIDEARAKGVDVTKLDSAVRTYEQKLELEISHKQIISAEGTFNKNYIPIFTDQASGDNQEQAENENLFVAAFREEIGDIVTGPNSTALPDAIAQISMYNIAKGKKVKSTGAKKRQIRESSKGTAKRTQKGRDEYDVITDGGPDISDYIKRTKRTGRRQKDRYSIAALIGIINEKLPQTVRKNMGAPRLESQTGRFAQSVKMMDASRTSQGYVSLGYTYAKNPYQVFETGTGKAPWATPERDPRRLIDQSIREVAAGLALGRFYTRRL